MASGPDLRSIYTALNRRDWAGAQAECSRLLPVAPHSAAIHHALGLSLCGGGRYDLAVESLERAVALGAGEAAHARDLGMVYGVLGRSREALQTLVHILDSLDPSALALFLRAAVADNTVGAALERFETGRDVSAIQDPDLLCEYGRALAVAGRTEEAEAILRRCACGPSPARAHDELAALYHLTRRGDLAVHHSQAFAEADATSGYAWLRLAMALSIRGRLEESRRCRQRAIELGLTRTDDWSSALKLMLCDNHADSRSVIAVAARAFPPAPSVVPLRPSAARARRLRLGYVSGEFDARPAVFFFRPFLEQHDRRTVEVFLYDTSGDGSSLGRLGEHHRGLRNIPDADAAAIIAADQLDVLVDLAGFFPGNRLRAMQRRPAPVQASLPNCPSTTGCPGVDYLLTDRWTSPEGSEGEYTEQLYRLASGYLIYQAPPDCPAPSPCPFEERGYVTFGLIQQLMKIGPDVWDAVAHLLREVPESRLLLHNGDGELARHGSETVRFLNAQLATRDVDPTRMRIVGALPHADHLALLGEIDIALDTWPFTGTTTTCECVWMGVPVVTKAGHTHASRVSAGLLNRLDLSALVTHDTGSYVETAAALARDPAALQTLRRSLRERAVTHGLTDGAALARAIEQACREWSGRAP